MSICYNLTRVRLCCTLQPSAQGSIKPKPNIAPGLTKLNKKHYPSLIVNFLVWLWWLLNIMVNLALYSANPAIFYSFLLKYQLLEMTSFCSHRPLQQSVSSLLHPATATRPEGRGWVDMYGQVLHPGLWRRTAHRRYAEEILEVFDSQTVDQHAGIEQETSHVDATSQTAHSVTGSSNHFSGLGYDRIWNRLYSHFLLK